MLSLTRCRKETRVGDEIQVPDLDGVGLAAENFMPVQTSCPSCGRQLRVPDELVGQSVKCPQCGHIFTASLEEGLTPETSPFPRSGAESSRREFAKKSEAEAPPSRRQFQDEDEENRPRRRRLEPHRGTLILVLGILAIIGVGAPITGLIAWILGNGDMAKIRAGQMDPEGESNTNVGRILGMVSTIIWGLGCGACCLFYMVMAMMAGAGAAVGGR